MGHARGTDVSGRIVVRILLSSSGSQVAAQGDPPLEQVCPEGRVHVESDDRCLLPEHIPTDAGGDPTTAEPAGEAQPPAGEELAADEPADSDGAPVEDAPVSEGQRVEDEATRRASVRTSPCRRAHTVGSSATA